MRVMRSLRGCKAASLLIAGCILLHAPPVTAQSSSPTPEQLQMFQGLTPEQQQAVLDQLGNRSGSDQISGGGLGGLGGLGGTGERQSTDQFGRPRAFGSQNEQTGTGRERKKPTEEDEEELLDLDQEGA